MRIKPKITIKELLDADDILRNKLTSAKNTNSGAYEIIAVVSGIKLSKIKRFVNKKDKDALSITEKSMLNILS